MLGPGQHQECLQQPFDPVKLGAQPPGQRDRLRRGRLGFGQRHVEGRAHRGQRGTQLVRGVGDEPALGVEGDLQPLQQAVDGVTELLELVLRAVQAEPLVQAVLGDALGRRGHLPDRPQRPPGYQPAERDRYHGHDGQGDQRGDQQLMREPVLARVGVLRLQVLELGLQRLDAGLGLGQRGTGPGLIRGRGGAFGHRRAHYGDAAGDGQQHRAGHEEQDPVQGGQPYPDGAAGQPQPRPQPGQAVGPHTPLPPVSNPVRIALFIDNALIRGSGPAIPLQHARPGLTTG